VNHVMLSVSKGDALPLEKSLRVLRENEHNGLEEAIKLCRTQLRRITDSAPED